MRCGCAWSAPLPGKIRSSCRLSNNFGSCPLLVKRGGLEVLQRFPVHRWEGETTLLLRENSSILLASVVILMASPKVAKSQIYVSNGNNHGSCPLLVKRGGLEVLQRFPVHRWEGETTLLLRENSSIL